MKISKEKIDIYPDKYKQFIEYIVILFILSYSIIHANGNMWIIGFSMLVVIVLLRIHLYRISVEDKYITLYGVFGNKKISFSALSCVAKGYGWHELLLIFKSGKRMLIIPNYMFKKSDILQAYDLISDRIEEPRALSNMK